MSAPLRLMPREVLDLARFLTGLTDLTRSTGVRADGYGDFPIRVGDSSVLRLSWSEEREQYEVDDRNGD